MKHQFEIENRDGIKAQVAAEDPQDAIQTLYTLAGVACIVRTLKFIGGGEIRFRISGAAILGSKHEDGGLETPPWSYESTLIVRYLPGLQDGVWSLKEELDGAIPVMVWKFTEKS